MELESRVQALIAVGAAVGANCQPCLQTSVTMALQSGADELEITEAIEMGNRIRKGAASQMDKFISDLQLATHSPIVRADGVCECSCS